MKKLSQKEKLLRVLIRASKKGKGVHSYWGYRHFMPRMGSRVWELKKDGYNIVSLRNKKDYGCTYYLITTKQ